MIDFMVLSFLILLSNIFQQIFLNSEFASPLVVMVVLKKLMRQQLGVSCSWCLHVLWKRKNWFWLLKFWVFTVQIIGNQSVVLVKSHTKRNKLGLSWAKLSQRWGYGLCWDKVEDGCVNLSLKLMFNVEVSSLKI